MNSKFKIIIVVILLLTSVLIIGCRTNSKKDLHEQSIVITDFRGRKVSLPKNITRIMTMSRNMDTIVLGMRKSDDMVAANKYLYDRQISTVYDKVIKIKERTNYPSLEKIYALKPQVVFVGAWEKKEVIESLTDMGIKVVCCGPCSSMEDIQKNIRIIASALSEQEKGELIIAEMNKIIADISNRTAIIKKEDPKSVVMISIMATYGGIDSAFDDMCRFAHIKNRMSEAGIRNGEILPKEMLIKCNPDILILPNLPRFGKYDAAATVAEYLSDPAVQSIKAVKNQEFRFPRHKYMYNFSQDFVFGVQELVGNVYNEEFLPPENRHISFSGE